MLRTNGYASARSAQAEATARREATRGLAPDGTVLFEDRSSKTAAPLPPPRAPGCYELLFGDATPHGLVDMFAGGEWPGGPAQ